MPKRSAALQLYFMLRLALKITNTLSQPLQTLLQVLSPPEPKQARRNLSKHNNIMFFEGMRGYRLGVGKVGQVRATWEASKKAAT